MESIHMATTKSCLDAKLLFWIGHKEEMEVCLVLRLPRMTLRQCHVSILIPPWSSDQACHKTKLVDQAPSMSFAPHRLSIPPSPVFAPLHHAHATKLKSTRTKPYPCPHATQAHTKPTRPREVERGHT